MKFSQITNSSELVEFLEQQALKHPFLYHYTTFKTLQCIFRFKTWRFGNARNMNDMHEYEVKGNSSSIWDNLYSACFSYGDEDNIAMWSMYGIPWEDAIRIRIPITTIKNWLDGIHGKEIRTDKDSFSVDTSNGNHKFSIRDICYLQGYVHSPQNVTDCPLKLNTCPGNCKKCPPKRILWWSQSNKNFDIAIDEQNHCIKKELLGYAKNSAWHHEMETRLVFMISPDNNTQQYQYIDIPISNEMISKMQISLGPRSTLSIEKVKRKLAEILYNDSNRFDVITNISNSYYKKDHLLSHLRRHCDCNHQCNDFKNSLEV